MYYLCCIVSDSRLSAIADGINELIGLDNELVKELSKLIAAFSEYHVEFDIMDNGMIISKERLSDKIKNNGNDKLQYVICSKPINENYSVKIKIISPLNKTTANEPNTLIYIGYTNSKHNNNSLFVRKRTDNFLSYDNERDKCIIYENDYYYVCYISHFMLYFTFYVIFHIL